MGNLPPAIPIHALSDTLLSINGHQIALTSERNLQNINWAALGADYVIECTGKFTKHAQALEHITHAHAKRVIISAPSADAPTYVYGVNSDAYTAEERVISCASCTTNCVTPVLKVLQGQFGIAQGFLTTVHAATRSQQVLDGYSKKNRRLGTALALYPSSPLKKED
jgi:glyceraldehyde 3-phosphate dehydrogenase